MHVDDAFVEAVVMRLKAYKTREDVASAIAATLAVAAERGMVVPPGAKILPAVKRPNGQLMLGKTYAFAGLGETVVRVAIVEIKE